MENTARGPELGFPRHWFLPLLACFHLPPWRHTNRIQNYCDLSVYGTISKSALRIKLVLHYHFLGNEREERLGTQSHSNSWSQCELAPRGSLCGWAQCHAVQSHLEDTCKMSFLENSIFWKETWQYVPETLKMSKMIAPLTLLLGVRCKETIKKCELRFISTLVIAVKTWE